MAAPTLSAPSATPNLNSGATGAYPFAATMNGAVVWVAAGYTGYLRGYINRAADASGLTCDFVVNSGDPPYQTPPGMVVTSIGLYKSGATNWTYDTEFAVRGVP